jgi:hypothetical protein
LSVDGPQREKAGGALSSEDARGEDSGEPGGEITLEIWPPLLLLLLLLATEDAPECKPELTFWSRE